MKDLVLPDEAAKAVSSFESLRKLAAAFADLAAEAERLTIVQAALDETGVDVRKESPRFSIDYARGIVNFLDKDGKPLDILPGKDRLVA